MKTVLVFGIGKEGEAALKYFRTHYPDTALIACEDREEVRRRVEQALPESSHGMTWTTSDRLIRDILASTAPEDTLLLRAPGIQLDHPVISAAGSRNIPATTFTGFWLSEAARHVPATVTGTKGKSTTTTLAAAILSGAGLPAVASGNIGLVPSEIEDRDSGVLLELSSYQLADLRAAAPIHAITNLYRDHLDWHGGFEAYAEAKAAPAIVNPETVTVIRKADHAHFAKWLRHPVFVEDVVQWADGKVAVRNAGQQVEIDVPAGLETKLGARPILKQNAQMAMAIAALVRDEADDRLCESFVATMSRDISLRSRCEPIGTYGGRIWIDDALATIPEATLAALRSLEASEIRLVAGGKDRGQNFRELSNYLNSQEGRIFVYAYGPVAGKLARTTRNMYAADSLEDALSKALGDSRPGAVILFSPAAASFEPNTTYIERSTGFRNFAGKAGS